MVAPRKSDPGDVSNNAPGPGPKGVWILGASPPYLPVEHGVRMTWARLDDQFHAHRKIRQAWHQAPASIGLHVMALTYCACFETDGFVDTAFVTEKLPVKSARDAAVRALIECGMWRELDNGYVIHDYLDYNPSRAQIVERRAKDAERKTHGVRKESERSPNGKDGGIRAVS
jgi:hypothetical protein